MRASHLEQMVEYHAWANQRLFAAAALVPADRLDGGELSQGSVLQALRHVVDVNQSWRATAAAQPELSIEEMERFADLASLHTYALEEDARLIEFVRSLSDGDLDREVIAPHRPTAPFRVWEIVVHIVTHRVEHGNEIGWALTRLGASPGEMGFLGYVLTLEGRG